MGAAMAPHCACLPRACWCLSTSGSRAAASLPCSHRLGHPNCCPSGALMCCLGLSMLTCPACPMSMLLHLGSSCSPWDSECSLGHFGKGFAAFHKVVPVCRQQLIQTFACDRLGSLCKLCRRQAGSKLPAHHVQPAPKQPPETASHGGQDRRSVGRAAFCYGTHCSPGKRGAAQGRGPSVPPLLAVSSSRGTRRILGPAGNAGRCPQSRTTSLGLQMADIRQHCLRSNQNSSHPERVNVLERSSLYKREIRLLCSLRPNPW